MIETLKIFMTVYEQRNFTRASEILFISQPTLSTKIKQMEQQFQTTFFIRKGPKSLTPTDAAHLFYAYAEKTVTAFENTMHKIHDNDITPCHIACSQTTGIHYLPHILPAVIASLPNIRFRISLMNSEQVLASLIKHEADIGFIEKPMDTSPFEKQVVWKDELVLVGKKEAPYWLMREATSGVHYYNERYRAENNIQLPVLPINNDTMILKFLAEGYGMSIVSKKALPKGMPYTKLDASYIRQLQLVYRKDATSFLPFIESFLSMPH